MNGLGEGDNVSQSMPWWQIVLISLESITGTTSAAFLAFYLVSSYKEHKVD
jgi:hypothetical protein